MFKFCRSSLFTTLVLIRFTFCTSFLNFHACLPNVEERHMCTMKNLHLIEELFEFETLVIQDTTKIRIIDSKIPKLGNGACKSPLAFMRHNNITELELAKLGIKEVISYAFIGCKFLKILNLRGNKIKTLDKAIFKYNVELERIDFSNNLLGKLHVDLFSGLNNLWELLFSGNHLKTFAPEMLRPCPNLEQLKLDTNDLFDLRVRKMLEFVPKLRDVAFNDNQIRCERVKEIMKFLTEKRVWVSEYFEGNGRERIKPTETVNYTSIRCLDDVSWATMHYIYVTSF